MLNPLVVPEGAARPQVCLGVLRSSRPKYNIYIYIYLHIHMQYIYIHIYIYIYIHTLTTKQQGILVSWGRSFQAEPGQGSGPQSEQPGCPTKAIFRARFLALLGNDMARKSLRFALRGPCLVFSADQKGQCVGDSVGTLSKPATL